MLIGAADVRRDNLEYGTVVDRPSRRIAKFRIVDGLNLDPAGTQIDDTAIGRHPSVQSHSHDSPGDEAPPSIPLHRQKPVPTAEVDPGFRRESEEGVLVNHLNGSEH
jgi:hypothetical protein